MKILAIESSCDETSAAVVEGFNLMSLHTHSSASSQAAWGGVVPMLARKKHLQVIEYVLIHSLVNAFPDLKLKLKRENLGIYRLYCRYLNQISTTTHTELAEKNTNRHKSLDELETDNSKDLNKINTLAHTDFLKKSYRTAYDTNIVPIKALTQITNPGIDYIAVTIGPGLAPALEVGIEAAKQLASSWNIPVIAVNHMEGHFWSSLIGKSNVMEQILASNQILGMLISGVHSELIEFTHNAQPSPSYKKIFATLDDAAGEAYDKFSVMLGLGYPGGAKIDQLAKQHSLFKASANLLLEQKPKFKYKLPVPLEKSNKRALSFAGLKTAAKYLLEDIETESARVKPWLNANDNELLVELCASFQYSVTYSIYLQLNRFLADASNNYKYLLAGGGVVANSSIKRMLRFIAQKYNLELYLPDKKFLGDNAAMIGFAGQLELRFSRGNFFQPTGIGQIDRVPAWRMDFIDKLKSQNIEA